MAHCVFLSNYHGDGGFSWISVTPVANLYDVQMYSDGKRFFWQRLKIAWLVVQSLMVLDLIIATGSGMFYLRFSRVLRPFMLLLK